MVAMQFFQSQMQNQDHKIANIEQQSDDLKKMTKKMLKESRKEKRRKRKKRARKSRKQRKVQGKSYEAERKMEEDESSSMT